VRGYRSILWVLTDRHLRLGQARNDGGYRGDVFLEMTFYANAPAPLNRRPSKLDQKVRLAPPTQPYKYPNAASSSPPHINTAPPRRDLSLASLSDISQRKTPCPPSSDPHLPPRRVAMMHFHLYPKGALGSQLLRTQAEKAGSSFHAPSGQSKIISDTRRTFSS